jgi:hypothetical protein
MSKSPLMSPNTQGEALLISTAPAAPVCPSPINSEKFQATKEAFRLRKEAALLKAALNAQTDAVSNAQNKPVANYTQDKFHVAPVEQVTTMVCHEATCEAEFDLGLLFCPSCGRARSQKSATFTKSTRDTRDRSPGRLTSEQKRQLRVDYDNILSKAEAKDVKVLTALERTVVFRFSPLVADLLRSNDYARGLVGGSTQFLQLNHPDVADAKLLAASELKEWGALTRPTYKAVAGLAVTATPVAAAVPLSAAPLLCSTPTPSTPAVPLSRESSVCSTSKPSTAAVPSSRVSFGCFTSKRSTPAVPLSRMSSVCSTSKPLTPAVPLSRVSSVCSTSKPSTPAVPSSRVSSSCSTSKPSTPAVPSSRVSSVCSTSKPSTPAVPSSRVSSVCSTSKPSTPAVPSPRASPATASSKAVSAPRVVESVAAPVVAPKTSTTPKATVVSASEVERLMFAPSVAPPQADLKLYDINSAQYLPFFADTGSSWTIIRADEAEQRKLTVRPWQPDTDVGIPATLPLGDSSKHLTVSGICELRLEIHGDRAVVVNAAVTTTLFCPCILGRNVLQLMDDIYSPSGVRCETGEFVPEAAFTASEEGYKCYLVANVSAPRTTTSVSRVEQQVQVEARISEAELMFRGRRIAEVDGIFVPRTDPNIAVHAAHAVVTGTVDWTGPSAANGTRRVVFLTSLAFAVTRGLAPRVLSSGHVLGRFYVGRVQAAPISAATDNLLHSVLEATYKASPLLKTAKERAAAAEAIGGFMFVEELTTAARACAPPLVIELERGARPLAKRNYPMTHEEELFAEKQIRSWLRSGTIRLSDGSPWTSPIVIAYHPRTGKPRLCIDYRALNAVTTADQYLMPMVNNITRAMKGKQVFSKIDLSQGFNQLEIAEESRPLTAFPGPRGQKYEFVGSPFGLRNIPSAFQRMMDRVLGTMLWERASVYIDDIIVFSDSVDDHHTHLTELAGRLRRANIFVKSSKCFFYVTEVEYLGYLLTGDSVRVMPDRVAGVLNVQKPKTRKELRQFLGLTGQFRHLVFNYAGLAAPLEAMKHKNSLTPFNISSESAGEKAYTALREALILMPTLAIPNLNLPFRAYVDASHWAMSMILCQEQNAELKVIAFYSKSFGASELIWSMPVKEATALHHFAMGPAWPFLASRGPHDIFVDSLSSNALAKKTLQNHKLVRHAVDLCGLNLNIRRIPGKKNPADMPTRPPFIQVDPHLKFLSESVSPLRSLPGWAEAAKFADMEEVTGPLIAAPVAARAHDVSPPDFAQAQQADAELSPLYTFVAAGRPGVPVDADATAQKNHKLLSNRSRGLVIQADGILIRLQVLRGLPLKRRVIPSAMRAALLEAAHSSSDRGVHGGKHGLAMEEELARTVWWPSMRDDCLSYRCAVCARQKVPTTAPAGLLHSTIASRPGQVVSVDVVPMNKESGYVAYFMALDKFSGAVAIHNMKSKSADAAVEAWDSCMGSWPLDVTTMRVDRDSILVAHSFRMAMAKRGIFVEAVFTGHQQANFVERSVQSVKAVIRTTLDGLPTTAWPLVTPSIGRYINTLFQSSKGASPAQICTGWLPEGFLPYSEAADSAVLGYVFQSRQELWDRISQAVEKAETKQAKRYNAHRADTRFPRGSVVLVRNLHAEAEDGNFNLSPPFDPNPWVVEAELSEVSVWLRNFEKETKHMECHVSRLRHAVSEIDPREQANDGEEFVVQKIHNHRMVGKTIHYLIEWGGYTHVNSYTWEPRAKLEEHAQEILSRYNALYGIV